MAREPHRSSEILDAVALLVVDMQDAFLNVMPDREAVLRRTALAIESARAFGIKVIFTEQAPAKLGPTNADLLALAPDARVFAKNEFSALLAEGLLEYLRRINVYHLLLAGIETPICIYQTALHAQDNELDVTLLSDCTTGRRPDDCVIVLESLARAECHVLPAETVFYSMLGSSLNARFAHFTRIVKRYAGEGPIDGTPTPAPVTDDRAPSEARHEGNRHGERQGDRHGGRRGDRERRQGERRDDRQRQQPQPPSPTADDEGEIEEPVEPGLIAEDGISESEANQPSYEEATAEHSAVEMDEGSSESRSEEAPREPARPRARRNVAPEVAAESEAASDEDAAGDDESEAGETSDETDSGEPGESGTRKKRGRRRRGGARRRRARERAAAAGGQPASENTDGPMSPGSDAAAPEIKDGGAPTPTPDGPPVP